MKPSSEVYPFGLERLAGPLDRSLARMVSKLPGAAEVRRLRWFWLDGLYSNVSLNFYAGFVPLFALACGANNAEIGQLTAVASLGGLIALFPGAQATKLLGVRRKSVVIVFGGVISRVAMLAWIFLPFMRPANGTAVLVIIAVNALITFCNYFANPAWIAMVADIVPAGIRGRFFGYRSVTVNLAALVVVPLAGLLIQAGNRPGQPFAGYQMAFALALVTGAMATHAFAQIDDPVPPDEASHALPAAELVRIIRGAPGFLSLVVCTLIWNLGVQMTAPFLNVYMVNHLGATTSLIGWVLAAASLMGLLSQRWLGRWVDRRGNMWVQGALSFIIMWIPIAWMAATAAWQLLIVNGIAGILWTGYGLASFNLLLEMAPEAARAEANALFQLVIVGGAVIGPVIGGHLSDAFGYRPMFILSAVLRLIGAVAFVWWVARPAARRARQPAGASSLEPLV